jgi:hypothetical protein
MSKMAKELQAAGYATVNVDYPSQTGPIEELAPMAVGNGLEKCREADAVQIHFVTHSMGGILLRYAQKASPIPDLGRVVMLAPPNQGSEIVDVTKDWLGAELLTGEAGLQIGTDENSIPAQLGPVDFELGIIAGTGTISPFLSIREHKSRRNGRLSHRQEFSSLYCDKRQRHREHNSVPAHRKVPGNKHTSQFSPVVTVTDAASFLIHHRDDRRLRSASAPVEYHRLLSHPGPFCEPGPGVLARRR